MTKLFFAIVLATFLSTASAPAADKASPRGKPVAPAGDRKPEGTGKPDVVAKPDKPDREKDMARDIGKDVELLKAKGLRGRELADAIQKLLDERGVREQKAPPAGIEKIERAKAIRGPEHPGLGKHVQALLDSGLRGEDLADAIHAELRRRGIGNGRGKPGAGDEDDDKGKGPPPPILDGNPPHGERRGPPFTPPGLRK